MQRVTLLHKVTSIPILEQNRSSSVVFHSLQTQTSKPMQSRKHPSTHPVSLVAALPVLVTVTLHHFTLSMYLHLLPD